MCDVSVMQVYWYLGVFVLCMKHPGRLSRDVATVLKWEGPSPYLVLKWVMCDVSVMQVYWYLGVFVLCMKYPGRLARDVATVLKWEGPSPYFVLTYVKWVMCDVSVMQVYWYLGVFVLCMKHLGRLSRDVATVLKWEGPSPYLVLTYVKWVMCDVSVMKVYWYLGVFVLCMKHPGRLARDVATVLKWEGPSPYLVLTYVKWVMCDVSVIKVYWYLGVFVLCMKHPGMLSRDVATVLKWEWPCPYLVLTYVKWVMCDVSVMQVYWYLGVFVLALSP